jgi:hypothetical protein
VPRHFADVAVADLKAEINAVCNEEGVRPLLALLGKDIKVDFDLENVAYTADDFGPVGLVGYHREANGFTYCGFAAGGDWEHPVFFLVYWDGRRLRGYVPTDGNPWNTTTKKAYGNDAVADLKNARKRYPGSFEGRDPEDDPVEPGDFDFDAELIRADFRARITPFPNRKE